MQNKSGIFSVRPRARGALAVCGIVLCVATLWGQSQKGDYSQSNLGRINQPTPRSHREGTLYVDEAYGLHAVRLAPGKDRDLVESYCNTCHSLMYITMQPPLPAAIWEAEVKKMVQTFGQPIPEDVIPRIIDYLQKHYTPETRKAEAARSSSSGNGDSAAKKKFVQQKSPRKP